MITISVEITRDQYDSIIIDALSHSFTTLYKEYEKTKDESLMEYITAYRVVLNDYMRPSEFESLLDKIKKTKKYDSKRLTDANNGL
jgi:hypothetical protein